MIFKPKGKRTKMEKLKEVISKNQNKVIIIMLTAIILLGVAARIYIGNEKAYFQIDEMYSYGLMNYKILNIADSEDFYHTWHNAEYYEDYLSISKEEATNFLPVYENQKNDVHPPFYYLLLRLAATFTLNSFTKWTGITLNIIIYIVSSVLLYCITNKIFKNKVYGLLLILVNSLFIVGLETTVFIRMYALNTLNLLIISYLHILYYDKEELNRKQLLLMSIFIIIGSLTHYYYFVFLFVLYVMYMVSYLRKKNLKSAIKYTAMMTLSAVISLVIFPYSLQHIFMGYRGNGAFSNLENLQQIWHSFDRYIEILNHSAFHGVLGFLCIGLIIAWGYNVVKNKKLTVAFQNKSFWLLFLPSIFYFVLVATISPYQEIRYIMPVCPFIQVGVFYLLKETLEKIMSPKKTFIVINIIFIFMVLLPIRNNMEISYLYKAYQSKVQTIEETHDIPMLYVMNVDENRFLDDVYLYTKIDQSYILNAKQFKKENLKEIFERYQS